MTKTTFNKYLRTIGILSVNFLLIASLIQTAYGNSANIILTPEEGISTITITGSGFDDLSSITVYWDNETLPTVPLQVTSDESGSFTCIISSLDQTDDGEHEIKVEDSTGNVAQAIFTVIDVKGPQGDQGPTGAAAEGIQPGYLAGWLLIAAAIGGIIGAIAGRDRQNEEKDKTSKVGVESSTLM